MTYKTYSSYKNSHIDWSSKIPDHWNIQKLKFVSQNMDNKRIPISAGEREEGKTEAFTRPITAICAGPAFM